MHDLLYAYKFVIARRKINGPVNFCAPQPIRNRELAAKLGDALNRPTFIPAPAFLIKLLLGEFGRSLLNSQRVVPEKLHNFGYKFTYPDIKSAVHEIVKRRPSSTRPIRIEFMPTTPKRSESRLTNPLIVGAATFTLTSHWRSGGKPRPDR